MREVSSEHGCQHRRWLAPFADIEHQHALYAENPRAPAMTTLQYSLPVPKLRKNAQRAWS